MCQQIVITGGSEEDQFCENIGELADALGTMPVMLEGYPVTPDWRKFCLCCVDIRATAAANNLVFVGNEHAGEWSPWCELRVSAGPNISAKVRST